MAIKPDSKRLVRVSDLKTAIAAIPKSSGLLKEWPTLAQMGDSLTENNSNAGAAQIGTRLSWGNLGVMLSNSRVDYLGDAATGGLTSTQIINTHLPTILALKPNYCTVLMGQNDRSAQSQAIFDNMAQACVQLINAGTTPIMVTNPAGVTDAALWTLNNWIRSFAAKNNLPCFDMHAACVNPATGVYYVGETDDNTHPNHLAIRRIAKAFGSFLTDLFNYSPEYLLETNQANTQGYGNPLFLTSSGGIASGWQVAQAGGYAIENAEFGMGNRQRITKTSTTTRVQLNNTAITVVPSTNYYFATRLGATVEAAGASWSLDVLDVQSGYAGLVGWSWVTTDIPNDTLFVGKFRTSATATQIISTMQVSGPAGAGGSEATGVGGTLAAAQFTVARIV